MKICPNCNAKLRDGVEFCHVCGAPVPSYCDDMFTLTLEVTALEARDGCVKQLRYAGAPEPLSVNLPGNMYDGMVLYVSSARFLDEYGEISQRPIRLIIKIKKNKKTFVKILMPIEAALLILCVVLWFNIRSASSKEAGNVLPEQSAVQEQIEEQNAGALITPSPEPTPYISPARQHAMELIPHFELRYYLNALDDRLLENFCRMYSAVSNFEDSCVFEQSLTRDELANITLLLSYECPELLQFSAATDITFFTDADNNVVSVNLPINLTRQEFAAQYSACSDVATALAQSVRGLSDLEKEKAAYDYLTSHCFYNYNGASASSAFGALGEGQAKCDGISLGMKWLCEEMGIPCLVMAGNTANNPVGHAWNIIRIDGVYYDLDVTNDVNSKERDYCYYGAYNVNRHWIRDKYPENVSFAGFIELPGTDTMEMSYHAMNNTFVPAGGECRQILYDQLNSLSDGQAAYVQFESWDDYVNFINSIGNIISAWPGVSKGSFNYSLAHLDEFQACRVVIDYL